MSKSFSKKAAILFLAAALAVTFAACGNNDEKTNSTTVVSNGTSSAASTTVSQTSTVQSSALQSSVVESSAPESSVVVSSAPESSVVVSSAPESSVVVSSAPESSVESSKAESSKQTKKPFDVTQGTIDSALIGSWEAQNGMGITYTFKEDKTLTINIGGQEMEQLYCIMDGKLCMSSGENVYPAKQEYSVSGDTFTMKDSFGGTNTFKRIS